MTHTLTILGLGPGDPGLLTREAWDALTRAEVVHLRTRRHPTVDGLPAHLVLRDFDALYDAGDDFAQVYARIVDEVIAAAQQGDVVYAVPGHPLVGEATVPMLLQRARDLGIETRLVAGLSFIEPALERLVGSQNTEDRTQNTEDRTQNTEDRTQNTEDRTQNPEDDARDTQHALRTTQHALRTTQHALRTTPYSPLSTQHAALSTDQHVAANPKSEIQNPKSFDPLDGLQICDALELAGLHHPPLNPDRPALIAQVYARAIASDVKLTLMNQYPPAHPVAIVGGEAGARGVTWVALHELDHADRFDHLTTLYLPAMPVTSSFEGLQETIAHLRAPEGCPWDREQTHESLRGALLEELYEVLTALDEGDLDALREELGDLLMNVIMQAQIATEAEEFRMTDVIAAIDAKLKRRHPHVFGDTVVNSVGEVLTNWNAIKQQEHIARGAARTSALDGIPPALPALAQAQKLAHKAERAGFQWSRDARQAARLRLAKVHEEIDEIMAAEDNDHRREELGDLLFTLADLADGFDIDAEAALREANLKFARRFRAMEALIDARGLDMAGMSLAELEAVWAEVKQAEAG